jgi:hypothetical protein
MMRMLAIVACSFTSFLSTEADASWTCEDRVEVDGRTSKLTHTLYSDGSPIGGLVNFETWGNELSLHWWPMFKSLNSPFKPPSSMSFSIFTDGGTERGYALFTAKGQRAVRVKISAIGPINTRPANWILFQPKSRRISSLLLKQGQWEIQLFDWRGRKTGQASYRFGLTLSDVRSLFESHADRLKIKVADWRSQCVDQGEDEDQAGIV